MISQASLKTFISTVVIAIAAIFILSYRESASNIGYGISPYTDRELGMHGRGNGVSGKDLMQ